jgi:hypothetical protein
LAAYQERRRERGETGLVRETRISPTYDRRQRLAWIVRGDLGAVEFHYDWKPEWDGDAWEQEQNHFAGVESHSPVARYSGSHVLPWECEVIWGECYPDGTSMGGSNMWEDFCRNIDRAAQATPSIFAELEGYYREWFEQHEYPAAQPTAKEAGEGE